MTNEKALLLLERYQGNSPQLPAHKGIDDTVYGSLAIYQKEIVEELQTFVRVKSNGMLEQIMKNAIENAPTEQQKKLKQTWETIKNQLNVRK